MGVIAADKILADFGLSLWVALPSSPEPKSKIIARILSLLRGAKLSYPKFSHANTFFAPSHNSRNLMFYQIPVYLFPFLCYTILPFPQKCYTRFLFML